MITFLYLILSVVVFVFTGESLLPEHLKSEGGIFCLFVLLLLELLVDAAILFYISNRGVV